MKTKRKLKQKWKNLLIYLLLAIFVICSLISLYKIIMYKLYENKIYDQLEIIDNNVNIEEVIESDTVEEIEIIEPIEEIVESNPYWDYINMNLIDVDFQELKSINKDVKGWIQVNGTNINYPFVQTKDNDYYLTHAFDKSYNASGWVFLDYRNDLSNINSKNTIIYAHGMKNKTMFGSLRNILTSNWLNNKDNYVIKLSTEYENTLWQIFSVYHIATTSDYIQTDFDNDDELTIFYNKIKNRSQFDFNASISSKDRILTLSTCYNKTDKVVLHAKLIKSEKK